MDKAEGRLFTFHPLLTSLFLFLAGFILTSGVLLINSESRNTQHPLIGSVMGVAATPTQAPSATSTPTPTNTPTPTPTNTPTPVPPTATPIPPTPTLVPPTVIPTPTVAVVAVDPNSSDIWESLAKCESGGNWAIDTGNGYFGGLQFSQGAWESVGGSGNPAHASRDEQISRGKALQAARGWGVWGLCAKNLGLN